MSAVVDSGAESGAALPGRAAAASGIRAGVLAGAIGLAIIIATGALAFAPLGPDYLGRGVFAAFVAATVGAMAAAALTRGPLIALPRAPTTLVYAALVAQLAAGAPPGWTFADLYPSLSLTVVLAGALLWIASRSRLIEALRFMPYPVVAGFVNGTSLLIIWSQVAPLLGLPGSIGLHGVRSALAEFQPVTAALGVGTIALIWGLMRFAPRVPAALVAMAAATLAYQYVAAAFPQARLGPVVGYLGIPAPGDFLLPLMWEPLPSRAFVATLSTLLPHALLIALVSALESALSAQAVGERTGSRLTLRHVLAAQGAGNLASGLCGGLPVAVSPTSSIMAARTAPHGGSIPAWAACGVTIAAIALLRPLLQYVPMVALAAVLFTIAVALLDRWSRLLVGRVIRTRISQDEVRWNLAIVVIVAATMVLGNVAAAVAVGAVLAVVQLARGVADRTRFEWITGDAVRSVCVWPPRDEAFLADAMGATRVVRLRGALFFATADALADQVDAVGRDVRFVIFDCAGVSVFDATGARMLAACVHRLQARGIRAVLAGLDPLTARDAAARTLGLHAVDLRDWYLNVDEAAEAIELAIMNERGPADRIPEHVAFQRSALATGLSPADVDRLLAFMTPVNVREGEYVMRHGDAGDRLYVILRGRVEILRAGSARGDMRLALFGPGLMFGEMAMLTGRPRTADALCNVDAELLALDRERFERLAHEAPAIYTHIVRNIALQLSDRLRDTTRVATL